MLTFSYSISPSLKKELEIIEGTRNKILLQLVQPKEELRLRWESSLARITASLRLSKTELGQTNLSFILKPQGKKSLSSKEKEAIEYKKAYDFIYQNWFLNPAIIGANDFVQIFDCFESLRLNFDHKSVQTMLDFIQVTPPEHPIVQAALAFLLTSELLPHTDKNIKLSLIASILFLYKYGFDFRGMLNLEEFIENDFSHFTEIIKQDKLNRNISSYLEYFSHAVGIEADKGLKKLQEKEFEIVYPASFYELSDRQKEILGFLDKPGARITNKIVQEMFGISQITASRDLAKLNSLGLIFSGGKGRSVYYTKI